MSASKKSGGSTKCCPCPNSCAQSGPSGKKVTNRKTGATRNSARKSLSSDCCDFDYGPDAGDHPDTPGGNPPCFQGENGPDGVKMKDKTKVKNDLKNKIKEACPNMSDEDADKMAKDLVDDIENKMKDEVDKASVPDKDHDSLGNEKPCSFTMCLDNYNVDPSTGTAEGDGYNDNAQTNHDCNSTPPNWGGGGPNFPDPGPIQNPPL